MTSPECNLDSFVPSICQMRVMISPRHDSHHQNVGRGMQRTPVLHMLIITPPPLLLRHCKPTMHDIQQCLTHRTDPYIRHHTESNTNSTTAWYEVLLDPPEHCPVSANAIALGSAGKPPLSYVNQFAAPPQQPRQALQNRYLTLPSSRNPDPASHCTPLDPCKPPYTHTIYCTAVVPTSANSHLCIDTSKPHCTTV